MSDETTTSHHAVAVEDQKEPKCVHRESVPRIVTIENIRVLGLDPADEDFYMNFSAERRKRITRKIDIRLIPMLALLYLLSHIDRANIGNAKIEGLLEDLRLDGIQWNVALSVFFIPYILLGMSDVPCLSSQGLINSEIPSNMLLKRLQRPSVYLGILIVTWGIVMTLTGVVRNFAGLMVTRILLGVFESGFFPGAVYLCSFWYMPQQLSTRLACFYCASALSGAFSGLLAAGIVKMDGVGGYEGWRWIFVLEGLATVVVGVASFFLLIDTPALSLRWLDADEIRYLELQLFIKDGGAFEETDQEIVNKKHRLKDLFAVLTNWKMYCFGYILLCQTACSYGTKFTLPTITKAMGFSNTNAQFMTVPPYVVGAISAVCFSLLSDRFHWRMPFVVAPLAMVTTGYSIILSLDGKLGENTGVALFSIIFVCMGLYPTHPATSAWSSSNLPTSSQRSIGLAFNICVGNIGGIVGSFMYIDEEGPAYHTGFGLSVALAGTSLIVALVLDLHYYLQNKKRASMSEDDIKERYSGSELMAMGDKSPLFIYTL
ncbi:major facilitator superfamily domain-containing protein [Penicillium robsamsonii]|uniref:major facilitator superfamily domain-containing protein n=1 Tax=Penicillium robsamsonii TaxID=1792511 RepID=UPI002549AB3D|nr:major facilitator superfamily domain-containing protein [Penicillium robsamsonii]KAJ5817122.1 major facilitator superfamily domain-containing protein [Penicillium robsamsonii]